MSLSEEQRKFYENSIEMTRSDLTELDTKIEEELAKVKDRLAELQNRKKAARQMYDAACLYLGRPNELEDDEDNE